MAKNLKFILAGKPIEAAITKIDRDKIYGYVEEVVSDSKGNPCTTAALMDDGKTLILSGATALKTVDEQLHELDKKTLKTVYMDGNDAVLVPSSYDVEINLQEAGMDDLFNLEVIAVYQLTWDDETAKSTLLKALEKGNIFRFVFNYRADYEGADAILLCAQNEAFMLTGRMLQFDYLENKLVVLEEQSELTAEEEEMDFGML